MDFLKQLCKDFTPPLFLKIISKHFKNKGFYGDFSSWEEACQHSTGYDKELILRNVKSALLKVKEGKAVLERDSVLFDEIQYSWPLLAGLMWIAAQNGGELNIVDFGGSLGSTYYQNRKFLNVLKKVRWNIVEQRHYVDTGINEFENDELRFYYDLESGKKTSGSDTILLSSVLQYMEKPFELLEHIEKLGFTFILVDRTPFSDRRDDRLCIQRISPKIFDASYPAWIFSLEKFKNFFKKHDIVAEFDSFENEPMSPFDFKGFIIKLDSGSGEKNI